MSYITETLQFLGENYSRRDIMAVTGIPQSTLSYSIRGERDLPLKYQAKVFGMKNQLSYALLFNVGVPSVQASLLSLEPIASVKDTQTYIASIGAKLTEYQLTRQYDEDEETGDLQSYIDRNYAAAYGDVVASLQASEKPINEWEDYVRAYQTV